jgi:hypothetical protein
MTELPCTSLRGLCRGGTGRAEEIAITSDIVRWEGSFGKVFPEAPSAGRCNAGCKLLAGGCFCVSLLQLPSVLSLQARLKVEVEQIDESYEANNSCVDVAVHSLLD